MKKILNVILLMLTLCFMCSCYYEAYTVHRVVRRQRIPIVRYEQPRQIIQQKIEYVPQYTENRQERIQVNEPTKIPYDDMWKITIEFPINSSTIVFNDTKNKSAVANIINIKRWLETHRNAIIVLDCYADVQTATHQYNMQLAQRRGNEVKKWMIKYGIDNNRILINNNGDITANYDNYILNRCVIIKSVEQ